MEEEDIWEVHKREGARMREGDRERGKGLMT